MAFNTAYTSFSTQSGFSVGWSLGISPQMGFPISTNFTSMCVNYIITHNSLSGNLSAWNIDKNRISFNPSISVMIYPEHVTNWARGKGFNSNNKVLKNFMSSGSVNKYNDALKYFGFEGEYDESIGGVAEFNPGDGLIRYRSKAFESYDLLRSAYQEELFHSKDYIYAKNNNPNNYPDWEYEEWRAQKYLYKNQGLYLKSGIDWVTRINRYGINGLIYDDYTQLYSPKWWHFLYKIPRKW